MSHVTTVSLEDLVTATYCAIDDSLLDAGIHARNGKIIPRTGPAPEVDDREVLCLAVLQELLGFDSDLQFSRWMETQSTLRSLFPRRLSRQNFADRRVLLTPLIEKLSGVLADQGSEGRSPFFSSIPIR